MVVLQLYGGEESERVAIAFEALEKLYFVLQELRFPVPARFGEKMLVLGYQCLPYDLFLQYVDAGIVTLTKVEIARASPLPPPLTSFPSYACLVGATNGFTGVRRGGNDLQDFVMARMKDLGTTYMRGWHPAAQGQPEGPYIRNGFGHAGRRTMRFAPTCCTSVANLPSFRWKCWRPGLPHPCSGSRSRERGRTGVVACLNFTVSRWGGQAVGAAKGGAFFQSV